MSFSPLKQENEQLSSYKDSSPWTSFFITEEQAQTLLKTAIPITLPYTDLQGRTIQLWKYVNLFVASIKQNGLIAIFSGNKIHNALLPEESSALLLKRLENNPLKKWHFSYLKDTGKFFIWPFLIGGGIDKYELAYNAALNLEHKKNKTPTEEHLLAIVDGNLRKECELIGAKREARNEPLMRDGKPLLRKKDGKPYNHIKETNNSQHGIKNIIKYDLRPQLRRDPPLSPAEKKQVQKEISMCSLILEYSERFHPSKPMKKVLEPVFTFNQFF
ncbi:MAG: polymorphic toxin type 28 domain-containing protein [Candidatus Rhabdochlamydia sp.]